MATATDSPPVTSRLLGLVLVVSVDNPPVKALGVEVRRGLVAATSPLLVDLALRSQSFGSLNKAARA